MNIASNDAARIRNHLDTRIRFPRSNSFCLERTLLQRQWSLINDNIITATQFQEALLPVQSLHFNNLVYNAELLIDDQLDSIETFTNGK